MRRVYTITIFLCILYFLGGWVSVYAEWITKDSYFAYAGVVGGLASVAGLFALTRPAITRTDFEAIEIETLRSLTETTNQLKTLESKRTKTREELDDLAIKKAEMELLVRKASLALFLKEQFAHHERHVLDEIAKNSTLRQHLDGAIESAKKLDALNEEIESNPNVNQLKEIIASASRRQPTLEEAIEDFPPIIRNVFFMISNLTQRIEHSLKITGK
jgi:predicted  nucleic acid-binding Zn-ribbon protein